MEVTKTILQKLREARDIIKSSDLKKSGRNDYSKYDYYTPEQVESLVEKACKETGTICLCNLKADEFGLLQTLDFTDIETGEKIPFELRTKHGSLKATNETQQMGGTDTYSERYIKMKVFQIKDNNLDCDSQDNRQVGKTKPQQYKDENGVVKEITGICNICNAKAIPAKSKQGRVFATCPNWKKHSDNGEKFKIVQEDNRTQVQKDFMDNLE
jgi:hypothetical protein